MTVMMVLLVGLAPYGAGIAGSPVYCSDTSCDAEAHPPLTDGCRSDLLSNIDGFFTENLGQLGEGAGSLYCQGSPLSVALGPGWLSYLHRSDEGAVLVRIDLEGANDVGPVGVDPLPHPTNFFKGKDPDGWVVGARSYRQVLYVDLWDGIDLRYRFAEGSLKYDLLLAPHADLDQVRFSYQGQSGLSIEAATGDLVIHTPVVDLVDAAPVSFQNGQDIDSRFLLLGDNTVAIEVDGRDPSLPLVIDPGLIFSTYIGGSGEECVKPEVDGNGDILLGGISRSNDFPTTPGVIQEDDTLDQDGVILKLKGDGSQLLFSTYIGTDGWDTIWGARTDVDGNVITTGSSDTPDFPVTPGAYQTEWNAWDEGFVMKLNHNCSEILWCTLLTGSYDEGGYYVEPMPDGSVMSFGITGSPDFPVTDGCFQDEYSGFFDLFISVVSADGSQLLRSTYLGGTSYEDGYDIHVTYGEDAAVYVAATSESDDYPVSKDAFSRENAGGVDIVVTKLDLNLSRMLYSTYIGGTWRERVNSIDVDEKGCVHLIGVTDSRDFPTTTNAMDGRFVGPGLTETVIVKIDPNGTSLEFSSFFGGTGEEYGIDIKQRDDGLHTFLLSTTTDGLPTTEHAIYDAIQDGFDIYIGVLDVDNQTLRYGSYLGGTGGEYLPRLCIGEDDTITIAAYSDSLNYPTTPGAYDRSIDGWDDIVVTQMDTTLSQLVGPDPPANLTAGLEGSYVELEWDLPEETGDLDLWSVRVYRGDTADNRSLAVQLPDFWTNWTDTSVEQGETYHYAVSAFSPAGESRWSNVVRIAVVVPPEPPGNATATAGVGEVVITWTAPTFTGWLPLAGYHLGRGTSPDDMRHLTSLGLVGSYTDRDVVAGIVYHYCLCAHNDEHNSTLTTVVSAVPLGPPGSPMELEATAGDGTVSLTWNPPENVGGSPIIIIRVLRGTDPDAMETVRTLGGAATRLLDEAVTNGESYHYAVIAANEQGEGPMSTTVSATPRGPPGPPDGLSATPGDGQVSLEWTAPEEDGGLPIWGYTVLRGISEAHMVPIEDLGPMETSFIDGGLINGRTVYYVVRAHNAKGNGTHSHPVEVTPLGPPGPPKGLKADAGDGTISLSWLRPDEDGGADIINYHIYRGTSADDLILLANISEAFQTYWDDQVIPGTTYHYAVSTVTAVYEGPLCAVTSAIPMGPPETPTDLEVIAGDREVTITWTPPDTDGGSPITGYVVLRGDTPDALREHAYPPAGTSYLDTGVINGRTYHYAVAAVNGLGTGEPTEPIPATPSRPKTVPSEVSILYTQPQDGKVTLSWGAPSDDGGTPVTGYIILRGIASDALERLGEVGPDATTYTDEAVKGGTTYFYSVVPVNEVGEGGQVQAREVRVPGTEEESPGFHVLLAVTALILIAFIASIRRR